MRKFAHAALLSFFLLPLSSCERTEPVPAKDSAEATPGLIEVDGAKAAEVLASDPSITIIDIRTPEEFAEGHLKGAMNIDFTADDFEARLAELNRDKPYLFHCASGNRSGKSLPVFEKLKFTRLYHLNSGFKGWVADGQAVEK